jgi:hypothetical protein
VYIRIVLVSRARRRLESHPCTVNSTAFIITYRSGYLNITLASVTATSYQLDPKQEADQESADTDPGLAVNWDQAATFDEKQVDLPDWVASEIAGHDLHHLAQRACREGEKGFSNRLLKRTVPAPQAGRPGRGDSWIWPDGARGASRNDLEPILLTLRRVEKT